LTCLFPYILPKTSLFWLTNTTVPVCFSYWLNDNEILSSNIASFAVVVLKDSEIFIDKGDNVLLKLNNIPQMFSLGIKALCLWTVTTTF